MKNLIILSVLSLVAFGGAYGVSSYLQESGKPKGESVSGERDAALVDTTPEVVDVSSLETPAPGEESSNESQPAAIRPRPASVEELLRLGMSLNEREKQIKEMEESVAKRKLQQQLALADLTTERMALDGLRSQIEIDLASAEELLTSLTAVQEEVTKERQELEAMQQAASKANAKSGDSQSVNTKKLSQWFQRMDVTKAAELLEQMSNDGQIDTVVEILAGFEEREAAKLLSAIDDTALVNDLVTKFRDRKNDSKSSK